MSMPKPKTLLPILAASLALTSLAGGAFAQSFAPGNLLVSRVGDGSAALGSVGTAVFLDQFTTGGTAVNSFNLSAAATNAGTNYTNSGTATSEGFLTRSTAGNFYTIQGYNAALGTTGVATTLSASNPRTVAVIGNGTSNFTTQLTDSYNGNNIRSSVYDNANALGAGSLIYTGGTAATGSTATAGVRSAPLGGSSGTVVSTAQTNVRNVNIFGNTLYTSSGSGTNVGVNQVNADGTLSLLTPTYGTGTVSIYDFVFTDANTLYGADDRSIANGGGLAKFTRTGGTGAFSYQYSLGGSLTTGLRGVAYDASTATFYATSADTLSKLVSVQDTGAASSFTTLATAATNTAFRGVEFVSPVPAPPGVVSAFLGLAITGLGAVRRRRKTSVSVETTEAAV